MLVLRKITKTSILVTAIACMLAVFAQLLPLGNGVNPKAYAVSPATQSHPADSQAAAHCNSNQTAVKITSGPNRGKWYCKDNPQQAVGPTGPVNGNGPINNQNNKYNSPGCNTATCGHVCGDPSNDNHYTPSVDIGCKGKGNPIMDALFGIIHFLSLGVGLVVIGSIIVGGIQYTASRGEPQATALAINRIRSSLFALIIYIFAYAALNYIIPGWVLQ